MGFYVHLHVCFATDVNDGVAQVAARHLNQLPDDCHEARWFLEELSARSGKNPGPKGGLSLWGIVGNHTDTIRFAEVLRPFWEELLSGRVDGGPHRHERVIIMYEPEQSEATNVIEIGWDNPLPPTHPKGSAHPKLMLWHHKSLPFSFQQF
jgi:hypothetical protein